jgi:hypothetical protein
MALFVGLGLGYLAGRIGALATAVGALVALKLSGADLTLLLDAVALRIP